MHALRKVKLMPIVVGLGFVYTLIPLVWLIISSTKSNTDLFSTFGFWFSDDFQFFENFKRLFSHQDGIYTKWIINTVFYAFTSATIATIFAALCGYGLAKYEFRGRELMFAAIIGAVMVPTTALVIPLFLIFSDRGLTNTPWAIILPSIVSPFGVFLSRIFAETAVPDELIEAARLDGATELKIFRTVAFPLMKPGLITVFLFALIAVWNNFFLPLVMFSDPEKYPVTVGLNNWNSQATIASGSAEPLFNIIIAGSIVAIVPLMIAFVVLQRFWVGSLTLGAID